MSLQSSPLMMLALRFMGSRWTQVAVGTAVIAALPAIAAAPQADERFGVYSNTGRFGWRLWRVVRDAIDTVPFYIERGNFRPLGRILEWGGHDLTGQLSLMTGLPVNVSLGVVRLIAVAVLAYALTWIIARIVKKPDWELESRSPEVLAFGLAIGASMLVSGMSGPVNLFAWLYLGSGAVTIFCSGAVAATRLYTETSLRRSDYVRFALVGLVAATFNEVTAIVIPASFAVVIARLVVLDISFNRMALRLPVVRAWGVQLVAFLIVFVPVRLLIASSCTSDTCYSASSAQLSSGYPAVVLDRSASGTLLAQWAQGLKAGLTRTQLWSSAPTLLAWLIVAVGVCVIVLRLRRDGFETSPSRLSQRDLGGIGLGMAGLALGTILLFSTSADLQTPSRPLGWPWRDSALTTPAFSVLFVVLSILALRRLEARWTMPGRKALVCCGVAAVAMSSITTFSVVASGSVNRERRLNNQIAVLAIEFVADDLGNEQRCALLDLWAVNFNDKGSSFRPQQLEASLDEFVAYAHGVGSFCARPD